MSFKTAMKTVLSASRRTDIPAFYMDWFMEKISAGFFKLENPFNGKVQELPAAPQDIHTIVFWSKNFGPFLEKGYGPKLKQLGYNLAFHFTINSKNTLLEPGIPPLEDRLQQLGRLAEMVPSAAVLWRFDPLCFYRVNGGAVQNNLTDFAAIARVAAAAGISRCISSFMDFYPKIEKRLKEHPGFSFLEPSRRQKKDIILRMENLLAKQEIRLSLCCEKDVLAALPAGSGIDSAACISHALLEHIYEAKISGRRDRGQRTNKGCRCMEARDIGSYRRQPCLHNCLFCYANPHARRA